MKPSYRILPVDEWERARRLLEYAYFGHPYEFDPERQSILVAEEDGEIISAAVISQILTVAIVAPAQRGLDTVTTLADTAFSLLDGNVVYTYLPEGPEGEALADELELDRLNGVAVYQSR